MTDKLIFEYEEFESVSYSPKKTLRVLTVSRGDKALAMYKNWTAKLLYKMVLIFAQDRDMTKEERLNFKERTGQVK